MNKEKTHIEKTAAEITSIGFDYQYYFFLWKLLSLETGESVGLEVKDDVHTELDNNKQIFYQIKHTIQTKSDGSTKNLTTSDKDLWKTLSNWAQVISDENDDRSNKYEQLIFLKKTSFVLASNKSSSEKNIVLLSIMELQKGTSTFPKAKDIFLALSDASKSDTLTKYINVVLKLEDDVLNEFLQKVYFELDETDIIRKCKNAIKADKIVEHKIDSVFSNLDSSIREDNFINIKNGKKIQISFDDFYLKYRRHYDIARNDSLIINEFKGTLPCKLELQTFIQQLIEVEDVKSDDIEEIIRFTRFKLKLQNNIDIWLKAGEITNIEVDKFKNEAINQWRNKHKKTFRKITKKSGYNEAGLKVLDLLRENRLTIASQYLDTDLSNGTFYDLSDSPCIGWRKDWEKYKK